MPWTTPTDRTTGYTVTAVSSFSGTWTASVAVAYILIGRYVTVRGAVTGGTINTAAFTLPAGYRPSTLWVAVCDANSAVGFATISTGGVVTPAVGSTTSFNLFFTFPVA